ncbi:putative necrosis-inducing factor-domain-containing protein [Triangularia setosa]|uniref:Necrosis-inducing factor-domain-containing protein n=1 Tax=Triangularia setosa TaxID=2587417 RepID=A0AAN6VX59_9PEZI|nr:putative necrosis-inducing factor-domain-containing protein [Podospora setosa]
MQLLNLFLAITALFTPSAYSLPVTNPSSSSAIATDTTTSINDPHPLLKRANHCGASSFVGETSGGSPNAYDCMRLHDNIAGDGTWTRGQGIFELAKWGNCKFIVENLGGYLYNIGNEDIRDLIRDSVNAFQRDGRVGATGVTDCAIWGGGGTNRVRWFIQRV